MDGYDIYKTFEDLFRSQDKRGNMIFKGTQSEDLCKIHSGTGDKKTLGIDHSIFYPETLSNHLKFKLTLAQALHVVKDADPTKLKYKLTNIQLKYQMVESRTLPDEAYSVYSSVLCKIHSGTGDKKTLGVDSEKS